MVHIHANMFLSRADYAKKINAEKIYDDQPLAHLSQVHYCSAVMTFQQYSTIFLKKAHPFNLGQCWSEKHPWSKDLSGSLIKSVFQFRHLSLWTIAGRPDCQLTHSNGAFFSSQSTLCLGNISLLPFSSASFNFWLYFCFSSFPGPSSCTLRQKLQWVRPSPQDFPTPSRGTTISSPLSRLHQCNIPPSISSKLPYLLFVTGSFAFWRGGVFGNFDIASWNLHCPLVGRCPLPLICSTLSGPFPFLGQF